MLGASLCYNSLSACLLYMQKFMSGNCQSTVCTLWLYCLAHCLSLCEREMPTQMRKCQNVWQCSQLLCCVSFLRHPHENLVWNHVWKEQNKHVWHSWNWKLSCVYSCTWYCVLRIYGIGLCCTLRKEHWIAEWWIDITIRLHCISSHINTCS